MTDDGFPRIREDHWYLYRPLFEEEIEVTPLIFLLDCDGYNWEASGEENTASAEAWRTDAVRVLNLANALLYLSVPCTVFFAFPDSPAEEALARARKIRDEVQKNLTSPRYCTLSVSTISLTKYEDLIRNPQKLLASPKLVEILQARVKFATFEHALEKHQAGKTFFTKQ